MLGRSRFRSRVRFGGGVFSPAALFFTGAQGAWYDPSDFSTLFQNSAGTTPVTAVEQPVRLMLDRSGRGNNATAPNDASRPVLRARYNLLTFSEQFDNAAWTKTNATVTANAAVAPDGTTTADLQTQTGAGGFFNFVGFTGTISTTYTASCFFKAGTASFGVIYIGGGGVGGVDSGFAVNLSTGALVKIGAGSITAVPTQLADGWWRLAVTFTTSGADNVFDVLVRGQNAAPTETAPVTTYIWGAQLLTAADATATGGAYQRIAAATDYDTSNPVWRPYLAFDGSDDSFSTSSIDFSATDEMTVFAGVTKLSDAASGFVAELSSATSLNNGSFHMAAPDTGESARFQFANKGTTRVTVNATSNAYLSPITSVLTGIGDISADVATLRIDGAQIATNTSDQGTGNYGNYPLFIGRRNNTSLPFNGRIYSLIVLGRTATTAELTATESWIAGKTGVVL